jgi:hypothetical protein
MHGRGFWHIGTSPLYTLNIAAKAASPSGQVSLDAVLGSCRDLLVPDHCDLDQIRDSDYAR